MDPAFYLPVPGTWAFKETPTAKDWYHPASPWSLYMSDRAMFPIKASRMYEWTTNVAGGHFWQRWFANSRRDHRDWLVAGRNLYAWLRPPVTDSDDYVPVRHRNLIAHSHGLQVVLYACASGLKINRLITVSGPVRRDMMSIAEAARPNIGKWLHVHSDRTDRTQWFGEFGDGVIGIIRQHPLADINVPIVGVGHSQILNSPAELHWWDDGGLIQFLRSTEGEDAPPHG